MGRRQGRRSRRRAFSPMTARRSDSVFRRPPAGVPGHWRGRPSLSSDIPGEQRDGLRYRDAPSPPRGDCIGRRRLCCSGTGNGRRGLVVGRFARLVNERKNALSSEGLVETRALCRECLVGDELRLQIIVQMILRLIGEPRRAAASAITPDGGLEPKHREYRSRSGSL